VPQPIAGARRRPVLRRAAAGLHRPVLHRPGRSARITSPHPIGNIVMNIAVTGGSGRLGRVLIDQLLSHGHTVRSLDRVTPPESQAAMLALPSPSPLSFTDVDMNVLDNVIEAVRGVEAVIHLAAFPGPFGHPPGLVYAN